MRILVIEDDRSIAEFVAAGLQREGYAVDIALNGVDGLEFAQAGTYDAAVVDVMLPRLDGLSLVTALRRASVSTPATTTSRSPSRSPSSWPACGRSRAVDISRPRWPSSASRISASIVWRERSSVAARRSIFAPASSRFSNF